MKNYPLSFFFFCFVILNLFQLVDAQNLVPNPSFEDTIACPYQYGQIDFAFGWSSFGGTPDYFNSCDQTNYVSVPSNSFGYQIPRTGDAYAGMLTYEPNGTYREYLGCQLDQPLVVGQRYFVSYWIVLGDKVGVRVATNKQGAKFTTSQYSFNNPIPTNNLSPIYSDSIISDTTNWVQIKGSLIADAAYEYLVIGCFFDDTHIDTLKVGVTNNQGYYFIDDVCVSTDSLSCFSKDGIEAVNMNFFVAISPNPFTTQLQIQYTITQPGELMVYDALGRKVKSCSLPSNQKTVQLSLTELPAGIYLVAINSGGESFTEKVVKE